MTSRIVLYMPRRYNPAVSDISSNQALPLELLSIAGPLLQAGFDVKIVDANIDPGSIEHALEACSGALCLGISAIFGYQVYEGFRMAKAARQKDPDLPIVWGGWFPSTEPDILFRERVADHVVIGQGEETFLQLVTCLQENRSVSRVKGLLYREGEQIVRTSPRPLRELDRFPMLPYHLLPYESYVDQDPGLSWMRIIYSRLGVSLFDKERIRVLWSYSSWGCPNACTFCASAGLTGRRTVFRSIPGVLSHLEELKETYAYDLLFFADANFFQRPSRVREFSQGLLERGLRTHWAATAEVRSLLRLSENDWAMIGKSGCVGLFMGAESACEDTLAGIRKPLRPPEVETCLRRIDHLGIGLVLNYIVGFPGESEDSINTTLREVCRLKRKYPRAAFSINPYWPLPGSELHQKALLEGYRPPQTLADYATFSGWRVNPGLYAISKKTLTRLFLMEAYQYWAYYADIGEGPKGLFHRGLRWAGLLRYRMNLFTAPVDLLLFRWCQQVYHRLQGSGARLSRFRSS